MSDEKSQEDVDSMFDEPSGEDEAPDEVSDDDQEESPGNTPGEETSGANAADYEEYDDLDLEDIEFPDDDFDEEYDENSPGSGKKKWIIIGAAVFIGVAVLSGGAMFFLGGDDENSAKGEPSGAVLSLKIPSKSKMKRSPMKMGAPAQNSSQKIAPIARPQETNAVKPGDANGKPAPQDNHNEKMATAPAAQTTPPEASRPRTQAGAGLVVPSVTAAAFKDIPMMQNPKPLPGPDKKLGESMGGGIIPKISSDGRQPWQIYAKPFTGETTLPRVGIIIKGLGLSRAATIAAINHTPAEVTLAFDPYAKGVGDWVGLARTAGHETLITLPMEPADFPTSDPGPFALQTDLQQSENIDRLRYILSVSIGNVGLLQMMGTRFATSQQALAPVLEEIRARGLLMIDDGLVKNSQIVKIASTIALPRARSDVFIDQVPSRLGILQNLAKLEAAAKKNKSAIGIAQSLPNSISHIMSWAQTLASKNLVLAPVSAIVKISGRGTTPAPAGQTAAAPPQQPATARP